MPISGKRAATLFVYHCEIVVLVRLFLTETINVNISDLKHKAAYLTQDIGKNICLF